MIFFLKSNDESHTCVCHVVFVSQMCVIPYQCDGFDSVEPSDGVLQLLRGKSTQEAAEGANLVHYHFSVHPALQTQRSEGNEHISLTVRRDLIHLLSSKNCCHTLLDSYEGDIVCEGERKRVVLTDLTPHQLLHLFGVAVEHLLQTQPE